MEQGWDVGDPIGCGNDIGAPEVPYMSYGPRIVEEEEEIIEDDSDERKINDLKRRANNISDEAWNLYNEGRYDEALIFIDRSLECFDGIAENWNIKAIILEGLKRYDEAIVNYDNAIEIKSSDTYKRNKSTCLVGWSRILMDNGDIDGAFGKVNEALEIFEGIEDKKFEDEAWNLKGTLLEKQKDFVGAFRCYKKALELAEDGNDMKQTYKDNRNRMLHFIDNRKIICPKCGKKLKITDNFCLKCGNPVDEDVGLVLRNLDGLTVESRFHHKNDNMSETIMRFDEE